MVQQFMFMCKEMSGFPLFQDGSCTMRSRDAIVTYVIIFERGLQLFVELLVKEFVHTVGITMKKVSHSF